MSKRYENELRAKQAELYKAQAVHKKLVDLLIKLGQDDLVNQFDKELAEMKEKQENELNELIGQADTLKKNIAEATNEMAELVQQTKVLTKKIDENMK